MKAETPLVVNQVELAGVLGVDRGSLSAWVRAGLPVHRRGRGSRGHAFDLGASVRWVRHRDREQHERALAAATAASPTDAARARKWTAEATRAELEVKRRAGELLERTDVERVWADHIEYARALLLALPPSAAPEIVGVVQAGGGPQAVVKLLAARVDDALRQLAGRETASSGGDAVSLAGRDDDGAAPAPRRRPTR